MVVADQGARGEGEGEVTRVYLERRNRQIVILVERRKVAYKDVPAIMLARGFVGLTYENVRKIVSLWRKIHNYSQQTPVTFSK